MIDDTKVYHLIGPVNLSNTPSYRWYLQYGPDNRYEITDTQPNGVRTRLHSFNANDVVSNREWLERMLTDEVGVIRVISCAGKGRKWVAEGVDPPTKKEKVRHVFRREVTK